jgi:hypothetical protein
MRTVQRITLFDRLEYQRTRMSGSFLATLWYDPGTCREHRISQATQGACPGSERSERPGFYNWRSKYGGMETSQVKRLKELEEENRRLKQMHAELSLDHTILKDIVEKSSKASGEAYVGRLRQGRTQRERPSRMQDHWAQSYQLSISAGCRKRPSGDRGAPEAGREPSPMGIQAHV